jgi:Fe2+ transport system protein FeoA
MAVQGFTIAGSCLSLLKPGEQGTIIRINGMNETAVHKLNAMGLTPGVRVTLESRSPTCVIKVGGDRIALARETAQTIYVRLTEQQPKPRVRLVNHGNVGFLPSLFKWCLTFHSNHHIG